MGKIEKKATEKHEATLSPAIATFIREAISFPLYRLPAHLDSFPRRWPFPRGDIYHWIELFNRFDSIYEQFNTTYGLQDGPQQQEFQRHMLKAGDKSTSDAPTDDVLNELGFGEQGDRELIEAIVKFSQLVFENCGNRSLYASTDQLSNLLNTTSLSLLQVTLRLSLRCAQRYSASRLRIGAPFLQHMHKGLLDTHYKFDLEKLDALAIPAVTSMDSEDGKADIDQKTDKKSMHYLDLLSLLQSDSTVEWSRFGGVRQQITSKEESTTKPEDSMPPSMQVPPTPMPARLSNLSKVSQANDPDFGEEPTTVDTHLNIEREDVLAGPLSAVVRKNLDKVPKTQQYVLLHGLRLARALSESEESRKAITSIRMLAIANLSHIYPETQLDQKILHHEMESPRRSQLPHQLCDVIHPPGKGSAGISKDIQAIAMQTLDALCNHKDKSTEVATALGVSASHGTLTYIVRKVLNDPVSAEETSDDLEDREWRKSTSLLLHTLPKASQRAGEGFLSAGLIDILIKAISRRSPRAEEDHPSILNFIDVWTYNTQNAFTEFVSSKGLDELASMMDYEVSTALSMLDEGKGMPKQYKTSMTDYEIPFDQQQTLRALVKFLNHMMGFSGGSTDRALRNLIESSQLLGGIRTIISKPTIFGTNVWSAAVNVFGSFIHNEPTSYGAIAEAGLVKAFLETITQRPLAETVNVPETSQEAGKGSLFDFDSMGNIKTDGTSNVYGSVSTYEDGVLASIECIQAMPQAFSAICLNAAGIEQIKSTKALVMFFRACLSPAHVKILAATTGSEIENLGRDIDELARHHPTMKGDIMKLLAETASDIAIICNGTHMVRNHGPRICHYDEQGQPVCDEGFAVQVLPFPGSKKMAVLVGDWQSPQNVDVEMTGAQSAGKLTDIDGKRYLATPTSADYVTVYSKFLLGFLHNTHHSLTLVESGCFQSLLSIAYSHSMPILSSGQLANNRLVRAIGIMAEMKPHLCLPFLCDRTLAALDQLATFSGDEGTSAFFGTFLSLKDKPEQFYEKYGTHATVMLKALQAIQMSCSVFAKALVGHSSRAAPLPLDGINLNDYYLKIIPAMGKLQLKCDLDRIRTEVRYKLQTNASIITAPPADTTGGPSSNNAVDTEHVQLPVSVEASPDQIPSSTLEEFNYRQVRHLLTETSTTIQRFVFIMSKQLLSRRLSVAGYNRYLLFTVADCIAQAQVDQYSYFLDRHTDQSDLGALVAAAERLRSNLVETKFEPGKGPEALTLILRPFVEKGGLDILGRLVQSLMAQYCQSGGGQAHKDIPMAALNAILSFFALIADEKTVPMSMQSGSLTSRSSSAKDLPWYFSPMQFLVQIRVEIIRAILPVWSGEDLERLPVKTVKTLSLILREVLQAKTETAALQKRSDPAPKKVVAPRRYWVPAHKEISDHLTGQGFPADLVQEAMYRCMENNPMALDYCNLYKNHPELPHHPMPATEVALSPNDLASNAGTTHGAPTATVADPFEGMDFTGGLGRLARELIPDVAEAATEEASSAATSGSSAPASTAIPNIVEQPAVVTVEDLDELRDEIRAELIDRCIAVLNAFDNTTFEMSDLIAAGCVKAPDLRQDITTTLIQSLISFQGVEAELVENAQKISRYAHLLGIIIRKERFDEQYPKFFDAAKEELQDNFSTLLGFLIAPAEKSLEEGAPWISKILLILEGLLEEDAYPKQISWVPPSSDKIPDELPVAELPDPLVSKEDKDALFVRILDLVPRAIKDPAVGLSFCRILSILTRDRPTAQMLGQRKNMQKFFVMLKQLSPNMDRRFRSNIMIILRHIVEDDETVKQYMRTEIKNVFTKPTPTRGDARIETSVYLNAMSHVVLRAPELFVEVTNELLELTKFDRSQSPQQLVLKKQDTNEASTVQPDSIAASRDPAQPVTSTEAKPAAEARLALEVKMPTVDNPDGVVQYLLSELMTYKELDDKVVNDTAAPAEQPGSADQTQDIDMSDVESVAPVARPSVPPRPDEKKIDAKPEFKPEDHQVYIYRCFILQCLTELVGSYNKTKIEFINYSRKTDVQTTTPSKPRSGVLNYLLNTLLPSGNVEHPEDIPSRKRSCVSAWAISLIVGLCTKTPEKLLKRTDPLEDEDEPELAFVRRFVLEHALKAFKEANTSSEAFKMRGSKLLAMADLFDRLLAGRPAASPNHRREYDPSTLVPSEKLIAKMMFEKNYISALTSSVADINLTLPGAKRVVKYILKPLRLLTHTAIEISMSSDSPLSTSATDDDDDAISSATSTSEMDFDREETPDFYRNSTLGMFEPGREEDEESQSEDEDEEDEDEEGYGDPYGEEMEYEEDEADSQVQSDEDEDMGPIEGLPGDMGMQMAIDMEGDDEGDDMDEDSDDSDEQDDDEDDEDDRDSGDEMNEDHAIEIMEELQNDLDDAEEDGEGWEDEGDDDGDDQPDGMDHDMHYDEVEEVIEMLEGGDEDESENDLGPAPFGGHGALIDPMADAQVTMEVDDDQLIDGTDGDEDDDGEEDFEEDEGYLDGGLGEFEEDDVGFLPPRATAILGGRHTGIPPRYVPFGGQLDNFMGGYRSHRPGGASRPADDAMNPLLDRRRQANNDEPQAAPRGELFSAVRPEDSAAVRGALEMVLPGAGSRMAGPDFNALIRSLAGNNHVLPSLNSLIQVVEGGTGRAMFPHLPGHHHHAHGHPHSTIQVSMPGVPGFDAFMAGHRQSSSRNPRHDPVAAVEFDVSKTLDRWREEANMLCPGPGQATAKAARVFNAILRLLVPPAMRAEKARKEAAEIARKEEEERQRKQAEKEEQERKERVDREQREAAQKAAEEAARQAQEAEQAAQQAQENAQSDAVMADVEEGDNADVTESAATDNDADVPDAPALQARPRVVTNIRGREIDITHLGIDLEFLDALPEDMRDEVIMGRVAEQRSQAAAAGQEQSTFDQDFLAALPAEIREEVLQQEAADRRRRDREEARRRASAANNGQARAEEMDPASFIATLDDPVLRQSLLAEADDDILALLPPDIAAEARALGGHHRRRGMDASGLLASMGLEAARAHPGRHHDRTAENKLAEPKARRPIIQMLDKAGVATLLRLMFVKIQGSCRSSLNEILRNACGNHQTRGEIISGLLSVLQDGTVDAAALDRAYSSLAARAIQPASVSKTPQSVKRTASKPALDPTETTPMVVIDHCLHALIFLASMITHVPKFFLTEHEALVSAKVKGKGKAKAKDNKAGRYPINSLFLLLEREEVVGSPALMELLSSLLQMLTVPLTTLLKKDKADVPKAVEPAAASSSNAATASAPDAAVDTAMEITDTAPQADKAETGAMPEPKVDDKKKELVAPEIPEKSLRAIINVLTARECSGKTFRDTLSTINNLCAISGARQIFGQELIKRARSLAATIQTDLAKLIQALKGAEDEMEAQTLALANFSPAGSDQSKLNRVLTALDYLFDTRSADNKKQSESALETGTELVAGLYEDPSFSKLWHQLGDCLSATQQAEKYFLNVATILLPLIEALMVVCKGLTLREARPLNTKASLPTTPAPEPAMKNVFFTFTNRHKKILNDLVRQNPKLMSGSFSVLVKNPGVLEFDNKRNYFNRRLHYKTAEQRAAAHPALQLNIRREQVFGDSYRSLFFKKPEEIKYGKLNIRFHGEEGVDAGGVTREWFQVLARQMFNADNALFNPVASDRTTFHPNPLSSINEDHLKYFHFIGRIIGKALYENRVLDCHFSRAVYKRILGKQVSLKDMETIDLEYTKSLRWMLENDITDIITETFSFNKDNFGSIEIVDLIEDGRNVPVTEENKQEYVRLVMEYKLTGSVDEQLQHFLKGFHDIVPSELISIFDEGELELLISGMPEIDVDDWKNNTDYVSYTNGSPQIQWFWRAVRSFDKEEQAKLLQFITGTGKVPLNGFKELEGMNGFTRFSIHKDFGDKNRLPSSHTCFNQLDLPQYESYEALRKNVYTAMTTGGEYFGFA